MVGQRSREVVDVRYVIHRLEKTCLAIHRIAGVVTDHQLQCIAGFQINALLDGELNDEQAQRLRAAAENDAALAGTIREAVQLRQAISNIPVDRAPSSLHRKLRSIPRQQQVHERSRFLQLRWGLVMATILVAVTIAVSQIGPSEPTAAEIAQARQELNLALTYLVKTSRRTRSEITSNIRHGFTRPVTDNTIRVISNQFGFNKE